MPLGSWLQGLRPPNGLIQGVTGAVILLPGCGHGPARRNIGRSVTCWRADFDPVDVQVAYSRRRPGREAAG